MRELSVREMRAGYGAIAEALEAEGELVLTHHGKPFAKVVPINGPNDADARVAERRQKAQAWAAARRRELAKLPELPPFDWESFRADRC